jgi:tetratricopeptide (TPR) repeat protein
MSPTIDDFIFHYACYNLGVSYRAAGNVLKCIAAFRKVESALMHIDDQAWINHLRLELADVFEVTAVVYSRRHQPEKVIEYYEYFINYYVQIDSRLLRAYMRLGLLCAGENRVDDAERYFRKCISIATRLEQPQVCAWAHLRRAELFESQLRYSESLEEARYAIMNAKEVRDEKLLKRTKELVTKIAALSGEFEEAQRIMEEGDIVADYAITTPEDDKPLR